MDFTTVQNCASFFSWLNNSSVFHYYYFYLCPWQGFDSGHITPAFALMKKRKEENKSLLYRTPKTFLPRERPRSNSFALDIGWKRSLSRGKVEQEWRARMKIREQHFFSGQESVSSGWPLQCLLLQNKQITNCDSRCLLIYRLHTSFMLI